VSGAHRKHRASLLTRDEADAVQAATPLVMYAASFAIIMAAYLKPGLFS
jgi:hypothetical protein